MNIVIDDKVKALLTVRGRNSLVVDREMNRSC